ncbi:MAG: isoaspartyl peptidase/L-asparaginase [Wenzhouxiangellaceae bacterium]
MPYEAALRSCTHRFRRHGLFLGAWLLMFTACAQAHSGDRDTTSPDVAIAIHGGAGTIARENLSKEDEARIRATLTDAVRAGHQRLLAGDSSLEAVITAIEILEDSPDFNAGRGAVLTADGRVELDASIMSGHSLEAGAVAGVTGIRHPIRAAFHVMRHSPHVLLAGDGAEAFARDRQLEFMPETWFITEHRRQQLERIQAAERSQGSVDGRWRESWFSTVGAVARDRNGHLAAGTSTGGTANKRYGRIGDSPIIGAGTYADDRSCAVSATGHGEFFIRHVVAHAICARTRFAAQSLEQAAREVIEQELVEAGGAGGVIAIDPEGGIVMVFNTPGMYRAAIDRDGRLSVQIFRDP